MGEAVAEENDRAALSWLLQAQRMSALAIIDGLDAEPSGVRFRCPRDGRRSA